jgi:hypothetical protein
MLPHPFISCKVKISLELQATANTFEKSWNHLDPYPLGPPLHFKVEIKPLLLEVEPFEKLEEDIFQVFKWKLEEIYKNGLFFIYLPWKS